MSESSYPIYEVKYDDIDSVGDNGLITGEINEANSSPIYFSVLKGRVTNEPDLVRFNLTQERNFKVSFYVSSVTGKYLIDLNDVILMKMGNLYQGAYPTGKRFGVKTEKEWEVFSSLSSLQSYHNGSLKLEANLHTDDGLVNVLKKVYEKEIIDYCSSCVKKNDFQSLEKLENWKKFILKDEAKYLVSEGVQILMKAFKKCLEEKNSFFDKQELLAEFRDLYCEKKSASIDSAEREFTRALSSSGITPLLFLPTEFVDKILLL